MRKSLALLGVVAALAVPALAAAPAQAATVAGKCTTTWISDLTLEGGIRYVVTGPTMFVSTAWYVTYGNAPRQNTVEMRLRDENGGDVPIVGPSTGEAGITHIVHVNRTVPYSTKSYLKMHAAFDVPFVPDPVCNAYTGGF